MTIQERRFMLAELHCRHFPVNNPLATVVLVHGIGEHCGRHLSTIHAMNTIGIHVVTFDLRGHGKSKGKPQWISCFQDYVDDFASVLQWVNKSIGGKVFVQAHSLGGAVVLGYVGRDLPQHFSGLLLNAPAYLPGEGISPVKIFLGRLIGSLWPQVRIPKVIDSSAVSRDQRVVEDLNNDPYNYGFHTAKQGIAILDELPLMPSHIAKLCKPILITHGDADRLIRLEGSQKLLSACKNPEKKLHVLKGFFHECHNDLGKEVYFDVMASWLVDRIS